MESGVKAIAYETIVGRSGGLPCLTPMSEIAGRMSVQEGAKYLEKTFGGRGVLLAGVPGVAAPTWSSWAAATWAPTPARSLWAWGPT